MKSKNNKSKINKIFADVINMNTIDAFSHLDSLKATEDADVLIQVASLLDDGATKTAFLQTHAQMKNVLDGYDGDVNLVGESIAGIKLLQLLGKGGMGEVYLGMDEKLQRKVAVKTIKGVFRINPQARERFHKEAKLLSQIDHENICKIYALIEYENVDFLVLEYIKGKALNREAFKSLPYKKKIKLAQAILKGLIAAHNENIVHRDLKPDNIIFTDNGQIKIVDFGISTNTKHYLEKSSGTNEANITEGVSTTGKVVGTLGYMSPEQANGEEVSTASDIYSLGVLLHKLFATNSPHPKHLDKETMLQRSRKGISEPMAGLSYDLKTLIARMKSKSVATRPTAVDCLNILNKIAQKPQRRKAKLIVLALILIALFSAAKYTFDLNQEKNKAQKASRESAQMVKFLQGLFDQNDPYQQQSKELTAKQMLDSGVQRLAVELHDQPTIQVKLKVTIATIYRKLGKLQAAQQQIEEAQKLLQSSHNKDPKLEIMFYGSAAGIAFENNNLGQMQLYLDKSNKIVQQYNLQDDENYTNSQFNLASLFFEQGKNQAAQELFSKILAIYQKDPDKYSNELITSYNYFSLIAVSEYKFVEALKYSMQAMHVINQNKNTDKEYEITTYNNLATIYHDLGQWQEAEKYYLKTLHQREKLLGSSHPLIASTYDNLATFYFSMGDNKKALAYNQKALEIYEKNKLTTNVNYALALQNKAVFQEPDNSGDKKAEKLLLQSLQVLQQKLGEEHVLVADNLYTLGVNHTNQKKYDSAIINLQHAATLYKKLNLPLRQRHFQAYYTMGIIYKRSKKIDKALALFLGLEQKLKQEKEQEQVEELLMQVRQQIRNLQEMSK